MGILFVEDPPGFARTVVREFLDGHDVEIAATVHAAKGLLPTRHFAALLVEHDLPDGLGTKVPVDIIAVSSHKKGDRALEQAGARTRCPKGNCGSSVQSIGRRSSRLSDIRKVRMQGARTLILRLTTLTAASVACDRQTSLPPEAAQMVEVPGGRFIDHRGQSRDVGRFMLDLTEVTVAAYRECVRGGHCSGDVKIVDGMVPICEGSERCLRKRDRRCNYYHVDRTSHPMNCVSLGEAINYCAWRGQRLPARTEWGWAARGREEARRFPWGSARATCRYVVMMEATPRGGGPGCGRDSTWPVGSKPNGASRDGALDMAGNVREMVLGSQSRTYTVRGGSFSEGGPAPLEVASDIVDVPFRAEYPFSGTSVDVGFRCAL